VSKPVSLCSFDASFENACIETAFCSYEARLCTLFHYVEWMSTLFLACLAPAQITYYRCSQRGQACISICVGVGSILLLEETDHLALGCWFVVTPCVAVSSKSICSERYLVE
jgi:hypothetical protein